MRLPLVLALLVSSFSAHAAAPGKNFQRIITVVLENTDYSHAVRQPFMASLAARGTLFTNFSAITHPSQPNYLAMISGSTQNVLTDRNVNLDARHLGDLLEEGGRDWRAYAEQYPGNCFLGSSHGGYARKHVPFLSFTSVQRDAARCAKVVNSSQFDLDAAAGTLPEYSFYVPDLNNDGHDTTPAYADNWLKTRFEKYLDDPAFMNGTLFVVTFDENEGFGRLAGVNNQVFTVMVGSMVRAGATVSDPVNHYSVLKLVEDNFGLGSLNRQDAGAAAIDGIWIQ